MLTVKETSHHALGLYKKAESHILKDLIDAFLLEDLFFTYSKGRIVPNGTYQLQLADGELLFEVPLTANKFMVFPVRSSVLQPYRLSGQRVFLSLKESPSLQYIGPIEVVQLLIDSYSVESGYTDENLTLFLNELSVALTQTELSYEAFDLFAENQIASFIETERLSSFRDRPFHPIAKAKAGWTEEDYRSYSPEFQQAINLRWVAVHRNFIRFGETANEELLMSILNEQEKQQLEEAFKKKGILKEDYFAMPIHPWQKTNIVESLYQPEVDRNICVPLDVQAGSFTATSSLRSLVPINGSTYHIKLPIGISSLGALRLMPTRYLLNGEKGQRLLEQTKEKDPYLKKHLFICDERNWWAFKRNLYSDKPGHLTCQIRMYPSELMSNKDYLLVSMAALGVGKGERHLFSEWLKMLKKDVTEENVTALFEVLCREFLIFVSRFLQYGILPELHGQNVVAVLKSGELRGFLLRDHDTVRIYPEWMKKANLDDPDYIIRKDTPNTLILQNPEEFLAYFQTLAVEVNLYAVIDSLCSVYKLDEMVLWRIVKESIVLAIADFETNDQEVINSILLLKESWPMKRLLDPLLRRKGSGGGSMPSSIGKIRNPFQQLEQFD